MRSISTIFALLALSSCLFAQEDVVDISLPIKNGQKVLLNLRFADKIEVKTWDKKELLIHANVLINGGLLNDAHKIDTVMTDHVLEISTGFDEDIIKNSKFHNCDGSNRSQYNFDDRKNDRCFNICHTINYTVFLPAETDLEIETISGDIAITNMKSEVEAKSVSGVVDFVISKNQKADIRLESVTGRAYTDPAMFTRADGLQTLLSRKIKGQLNGGGKHVHLESVSGDVRLRHPD
jgi:hypothetical protein